MRFFHPFGRLLGRTFIAFFPAFARPDDAFAKSRLSPEEYALYLQMDVRDRDHACAVSAALSALPEASPKLIRAALLHDIGKSGAQYNPWERIIVHLYTPPTMPREPRLRGLRGSWQRRLHHDHYGAELILHAGGDAEVAEIVRLHHHPESHLDAALLQKIEARF